MEVTKDLAAAVQLCFAVFSLPADLHRSDVAYIGDIGSQLQPILLRLQKAALQCEAVTSDHQLLAATASIHTALQGLQQAAGRCRVRHWLLRVLAAKDVRLQLTAAVTAMSDALQQLTTAAADGAVAAELPQSYFHSLEHLQRNVAKHRVRKHEALEALARGLLKHITDERLDEEQLPSMLKYVVKQAVLQTQQKAHAINTNDCGAGSSSNSNSGSYSGASNSKVPAGESSLTDTELLMVLEQMAASSTDKEQLALYQILSTVEGLQEAKRREQREHHRRKLQRRHQQQQQSLPRVSESGDTTADAVSSIPAEHGNPQASHMTSSSSAVAVVCDSSATGTGGEASGEINVSDVVTAMMTRLEAMLWQDPWDTAALTQILELLLQVESVNEDSRELQGSKGEQSQRKQHADIGGVQLSTVVRDQAKQEGNKKGTLWSMGAVARSILQSRLATRGNSSRGELFATCSKSRQQPALTAAQLEQKAAWAERIHVLAAAALDALLHLTPRPMTSSSFLNCSSRAGTCTEEGRSLALPLMAHADSVPALAACLWSDWPDVGSKAAQLLAILLQSGSTVAEAGTVNGSIDGVADTYVRFCKRVCSTTDAEASSSTCAHRLSVWHGLAMQLHSSNHVLAGAAAETLAAIASNTVVEDMCSSLSATQQLRSLLLLLSRYKVHSGVGGAAAAALHALSDKNTRPAVHQMLANSFWQELPLSGLQQEVGTVEALGELLLRMMGCSDLTAAARAAQLTASLAPAVCWAGRQAAWVDLYKAAQHLLETSNTNGCSAGGSKCINQRHHDSIASSVVRTCGAQLLVQLVGSTHEPVDAAALNRPGLQGRQQQCMVSPMLAAGVDPVYWNDLLFESLQISVQQFSVSSSWQGVGKDLNVGSNIGVANEGLAAVQLLKTILCWLPDDARCALPDMPVVVLPILEYLIATQQGVLLLEAHNLLVLLGAEC